MSLRFGDRLRVSIDIEPETRDARVPKLFLQPLVENSFRHGFGDLAPGRDRDTVRRDGDMLRCDVVDNGRGLRAGHKEGVGLASTRAAARAPVRRPAHLLALAAHPATVSTSRWRFRFTPRTCLTAAD